MWSLKAKFHYASWFEAGRRQVRSWSPTSFDPVCNQLRTSFKPDSVMEFGFSYHRRLLLFFCLLIKERLKWGMLQKNYIGSKFCTKHIVYVTDLYLALSWALTVKTVGVVDSQLELITVTLSVVGHRDPPRVHGRVGRVTQRWRRQWTLQFTVWHHRGIIRVHGVTTATTTTTSTATITTIIVTTTTSTTTTSTITVIIWGCWGFWGSALLQNNMYIGALQSIQELKQKHKTVFRMS